MIPAACQSPLSTKLVCGDCGGFYGSKVWGSNTKYRRIIWRCNEKYKGDAKCSTPHVTEEEIKQRFLEAFNSILEYREEIIANCRLAQATLCDCSSIEVEIDELLREIEVITELSEKAIYENAHTIISQDEWNDRNNGYIERHRKAAERLAEIENLKRSRQTKKLTIDSFIQVLKTRTTTIYGFDERLWMAVIDMVKVLPDGKLVFRSIDGTEIVN